jgi:type I restriction enzyme S subunit
MSWNQTSWGDVSNLRYGKALRGYSRGIGSTEVFGTNGPIGWTTDALGLGPRPVVGRKGAYRGVHLARGPFWVIDTAFWLEPGPKIDPLWAYYKLLTLDINSMDSGSAIPSLTRDQFRALPLLLPHLDEQRRIAEVLGALDDLIDQNDRVVEQTLTLARALGSSASGSIASLADIAASAPTKTVTPFGITDHYSLPAFDEGAAPERLEGSAIKSNKILIEDDVVLVSRLNPHIPRVWAVYPEPEVVSVASTEFVPIRGKGVAVEEVYAVVSSDAYLSQLSSRVTGTTGSHQRVDKRALFDLEVPDIRALPPASREAIRDLVREAHASRTMCSELRRTRDELLPLLMSGRIRVRAEGTAA